MITLDDIQSFVVSGPMCAQSWPCQHRSTVTLKDGRTACNLDSPHIWAIVSELGREKINPQGGWSADEVKEHFERYKDLDPDLGWAVKPADVLLTEIFAKAAEKKPNIDKGVYHPDLHAVIYDL